MVKPAPPIDKRTATDIAKQVQDLLKLYAPNWQEFDPVTGKPKGISAALIGVFARFAEITIGRLNQVPNKNFLAFLDLLGASLLPPQPARVPLTFSLAAGSTTDAVVPEGTQVAAPPAEGEKEPVIFETERELVVTAAQLASIFVRDPEQDTYADNTALAKFAQSIAPEPSSIGVSVFQGHSAIEHILYLGHSLLLGLPQIQNLTLNFTLAPGLLEGNRQLQWEFWDGIEWKKLPIKNQVIKDSTQNLRQSGDIELGSIDPILPSYVNSLESRWLRCRLITPITDSLQSVLNMVSKSQLPQLKQVKMQVHLLRSLSDGLPPELAFTNSIPIELGKDFFPFGEKPQFNDTLYLASSEAFSKPGATIQLEISLINSHLLPAPTSVRPTDDLRLTWEVWDGSTWNGVGISDAPSWLSLLELDPLPSVTSSQSQVVQGTAQSGATVSIQSLTQTAATSSSVVVGEDRRFAVRVSLSAGVNVFSCTASYKGRTTKAWIAIFQETQEQKATIQLNSTGFNLPETKPQIDLTVEVTGDGANSVQNVRVTNGRNNTVVTKPKGNSLTIQLEEGRNALLIEGLAQGDRRLAATSLTLGREAKKQPDANESPDFFDGTYAFCQSGIVTLKLPNTVSQTAVNGQDNYWLRVRLINGNYGKEASYNLTDPTNPAAGFTLVLASFRPPIISPIKIGYEQTLTENPQYCLAYNNLEFADFTATNLAENQLFPPFIGAPEEQPTLYFGFTLPPNRTEFPNRKISLFARVADYKYGEKTVPIWPNNSRAFGTPGSVVKHTFTVTNAGTRRATFELTLLGTVWNTVVVPQKVELQAGDWQEVDVQVTIGTALHSSDRGFLRLTKTDEPDVMYSASFVTFAQLQPPESDRLQLAWDYWNGEHWTKLLVRDETEAFTRPGLIEFLPPANIAMHPEFGLTSRYWLRVYRQSGDYQVEPKLLRVLLNTTMAAQTVTIHTEILGSSDGSENQTFRTTRAPILAGQQLQVREVEIPSTNEQAIVTVENQQEIWVLWHQVPDFYGSGSRDRHYVLDHLTGEISFGNGLNGLIPPIGIGNLRLTRYQTGGGIAGNKPAGAIVQLKTTIPYVETVINTEPATGGANAETLDSLIERAPRTIRHRGRAVTLEDYEDLALLASPEVVRAKCIPLINLIKNPLDTTPDALGEVSVIILPRSQDAKPLPSVELINRVQDYLQTHGIPTVNVSVVGPLYVSVNITAEIALMSLEGASAVEQAIYQTLDKFLHPLFGGFDGTGWDFGREPYKSDFYALLEAVPGVEHIRNLVVFDKEDRPGIKETRRFLVYSGKHKIDLVFAET